MDLTHNAKCFAAYRFSNYPHLFIGVPEADSDIHLFVIYSYRFNPPEKMDVRFNSIEAISRTPMAVRGEYNDEADMNGDGGGHYWTRS